jgi:hypothetical protein
VGWNPLVFKNGIFRLANNISYYVKFRLQGFHCPQCFKWSKNFWPYRQPISCSSFRVIELVFNLSYNKAVSDHTLTISRISPFWLYSVQCLSHRLIGLLVSITVACHFILEEHPFPWHTSSSAPPPSSLLIFSPYFVMNKRITNQTLTSVFDLRLIEYNKYLR